MIRRWMPRCCRHCCSSVLLKESGVVLPMRMSLSATSSPSASCQPSLPNWKSPLGSSCWISTTGMPAARALALRPLMADSTRSISKAA
ncbi:hypothetical protein FQZ97_1141300 [compost metagenome]